jgi:hypothetical protein
MAKLDCVGLQSGKLGGIKMDTAVLLPPVPHAAPVLAGEKASGFSRARPFWGKLSSKSSDDGALITSVPPMNRTKNKLGAILKHPSQNSFFLDEYLQAARKEEPQVNFSHTTCSPQEARDEDNTADFELIHPINVVAEERDPSSMDDGIVTSKGTMEPDDTPAQCHPDPSEVDAIDRVLADPSSMQEEGSVSIEGTTEPLDISFPPMQGQSSVLASNIPFHYQRDIQEDAGIEAMLPVEVVSGIQDIQEDAGIEATLPIKVVPEVSNTSGIRDIQKDAGIDAILPITVVPEVSNTSGMQEKNALFNVDTVPSDTSLSPSGKSSVNFQIPFHYHRDILQVDDGTAEVILPTDVIVDVRNPLETHEKMRS